MGNVTKPPDYVMETLKLGPRNPVLTQFDEKDVLCEVDLFLEHCEKKLVTNETINDINMETLNIASKPKCNVLQGTYK